MPEPSKPTVALVVAAAENYVIGANNTMPWHLPADLRNFKELTTGYPVVMGRKTYESIGKPLPNRTNIVITAKRDYQPEGVTVAHSLTEALQVAGNTAQVSIIGGATVYQEALERRLADIVYMTRIHAEFDGDVYFPPLNAEHWSRVSERFHHKDTDNPYDFTFETWIRKG